MSFRIPTRFRPRSSGCWPVTRKTIAICVGKLMIVGDPKQSIYRFRRARVTVFFRMMHAILEHGGVMRAPSGKPPLRRSDRRIRQSALGTMMDGAGKCAVPEHVDLVTALSFPQDDILMPAQSSRSLGITYIAADADSKASAGREMEAEALARLLKKWRTSGTIQSWKEVAMLFRVMTNMDLYIDALEPTTFLFTSSRAPSFIRRSEVSDLSPCLNSFCIPRIHCCALRF